MKNSNEDQQKGNNDKQLKNNKISQYDFNDIPLPYQMLDGEGTILSVNTKWLNILGYPEEQVTGKKVEHFLTPESQVLFRESLEILRLENPSFEVQLDILNATGNKTPFHVVCQAKILNSGKIAEISCLFESSDPIQTQTKEYETACKNYKIIIEKAPYASIIIQDDIIKYSNPENYELLEGDESQIIGKNISDFIHSDSEEQIEYNKLTVQNLGKTEPTTIKLISLKDNIRYIEASSVLIDWEGNNAILIIGKDITKQVRAEEKLKKYRESSSDIISAIPVSLIIYQFRPPDKLILLEANSEALQINQIGQENSIGMEFNELWPETIGTDIKDKYISVQKSGEILIHEEVFIENQRIIGAYKMKAFPLPDSKIGLAIVNITEQKKQLERQELQTLILKSLISNRTQEEIIKEILALIVLKTGCDTVSISLVSNEKVFKYRLERPSSIERSENIRESLIDAITKNEYQKTSLNYKYTLCNILRAEPENEFLHKTSTDNFLITDFQRLIQRLKSNGSYNIDFDEWDSMDINNYLVISLKTSDHEIGFLEISFNSVDIKDKVLINYFENIGMTISEALTKKAYEEELMLSEERFRSVISTIPVLILAFNKNDEIIYWNKYAESITGYTLPEISFSNEKEKILSLRKNGLSNQDSDTSQQVILDNIETEIVCKTGEIRVFSWTLMTDKTEIPGWENWMLGIDITERFQTENALRESEQKFASAFMAGPDSIVISSVEDGKIIQANEQFYKSSGFSPVDVIGKLPAEFNNWVNCEERKRYVQLLKENGEVDNFEVEFRHKKGYLVPCLLSARLILIGGKKFLISISKDITDIKNAEHEKQILDDQLKHAQKMEAIGKLAGGIAHDFNNLLQTIQGYTELSIMKLPQDSHIINDLQQIKKAVESASNMTRQLLTFSKREQFQPKYLDLNELIKSIIKMLSRLIGEHIELSVNLGENLKTIYADPGQIEQLITNLCINSRDAMPDGGRITINTRLFDELKHPVEDIKTDPDTEYILLQISDTGTGIDPALGDRIFEPFFTTKEYNESTGLGLATSYAIVNRHNGFIRFDSEIGKGTTFKIFIPSKDVTPSKASFTEDDLELYNGSETILFAEDDEMVRNMTIIYLKKAGYKVLPAMDGQEAIDLIDMYADKIDIALLDVIMPKKNGREVFERISEIRPSIPVLFSSGYSYSSLGTNQIPRGSYLIQKPYPPLELLKMLRNILQGEEETTVQA